MTETTLNPLAEVLPELLREIGVTSKNFAVTSVVENELAQVCPTAKIVGFKNNRIYVEVESSAELQELTFKRREILKIVHDTFPLDSISSPVEMRLFLRGMAHPSSEERAKQRNNAKNKRTYPSSQ